jgi:hypothetical protein
MIPSILSRGSETAPDPMKARSLYTSFTLLALAVALVAVCSVPVRAQRGAVLLQCTAGFGDMSPATSYSIYRHLGEWVPFRIKALNVGPSISGTLVVVIEDYSGRPSRYEKRIDLPSGAQQSHEILARVIAANKEPVVAFEVDGVRAAEIEVPLSKAGGEQLRLGVLDREATALNDISSATVDPSDSRQPFTTHTAAPPVDPNAPVPSPYTNYGLPTKMPIAPLVFDATSMPHHWIGYASLDALVINEAPLSEVDEAQAAALRTWVASGGLLVVTGGADFPGLRRVGLDALLPVDVLEKRTVTAVGDLPATYGGLDSSAGALLAVGTLRQGADTLLNGGDGPIAAQRRYGAGWVRFVAINPKLVPFRGWAGSPTLWADLLRPVAERSFGRQQAMSYNVGEKMNLLYDLANVRAPLVGYYFLYLLVYLFVLGPLNYVVLRLKGRLEWAWVTIPAAVILFSLGTVVVARVMRGGNSMMVSVSVDQYFQREGVGFSRSSLLVVPSSKDEYRIGLAEGSGCMPSSDFSGNGGGDFTLDETDPNPSIVANLNTWDVKSYEVLTARADEPPASVRLLPGGVDIANSSEDTLRSAAVITREGIFFVGDVSPGATASSRSVEVAASPFTPWYTSKLGSFADGRRLVEGVGTGRTGGWATPGSAPSDDLFAYGTMTQATLSKLERPLLVAVREGTKTAATLEAGARERRLSLVVVYLEEGAR